MEYTNCCKTVTKKHFICSYVKNLAEFFRLDWIVVANSTVILTDKTKIKYTENVQYFFNNSFTQHQLMFSLKVDQKGPKRVRV